MPTAPSAQLFLEYYQGGKAAAAAAKNTSESTEVVAGSGADNGDSDTTLHLG